jgi:hypothetical protein
MAMKGLKSLFANMFTGGGGQNMAMGGTTDLFSFHKGGRVPYDGIPRLHKGLASDEYPAILQAGETVIPRGGSAGPSVSVVINNNTSAQATTKETRTANGGLNIEVLIDEAIGKSIMQQRGRTYAAMKNTFGARSLVGGR